ncbi:hypothetical protein D9M69_709100 [compost metagenome]
MGDEHWLAAKLATGDFLGDSGEFRVEICKQTVGRLAAVQRLAGRFRAVIDRGEKVAILRLVVEEPCRADFR